MIGDNGVCEDVVCQEWDNLRACAVIGPPGEGLNSMNEINIFPNPTEDEVQIELSFDSEVKYLELRNEFGKIIQVPVKKASDNTFHLDMSSQPRGVYHLHIKNAPESNKKMILKVLIN